MTTQTYQQFAPEGVKVCAKHKRNLRLTLTLPYLRAPAGQTTGVAEFEVTLIDSDGYMEAATYRFSGDSDQARSRKIDGLSPRTIAVYVMPMSDVRDPQPYLIEATFQ